MEFENNIKEAQVSEPLQHLLSLKWETLPDITTTTKEEEKGTKSFKQVKRVRFSDDVKQNFLDSYDDDNDVPEITPENKMECDYDTLSINEKKAEKFDKFNNIDDNILQLSNNQSVEYDELLKPFESGLHVADIFVSELQEEQVEDKTIFLENGTNNTFHNIPNFDNEPVNYINNTLNAEQNNLNNEEGIVERIASIYIGSDTLHLDDNPYNGNHTSADEIKDNSPTIGDIMLNKSESSKILICQKQTEKINTLLTKSDYKFSSIPEMKSKVIEAWSLVKKKEIKNSKVEKKLTDRKIEKKVSTEKHNSKDVHVLWKKSKCRRKKSDQNKNATHNIAFDSKRKKSEIDEKEIEMVFKSWKKQKDILLKQEAEKKQREKQEQNIALLMSQQIKKEDADSAYSAWLSYKAETKRKEKLKEKWLEQKKKDIDELKLQKDKEALKIYNLWLENKYYEKKPDSTSSQNQPPWIPSGY